VSSATNAFLEGRQLRRSFHLGLPSEQPSDDARTNESRSRVAPLSRSRKQARRAKPKAVRASESRFALNWAFRPEFVKIGEVKLSSARRRPPAVGRSHRSSPAPVTARAPAQGSGTAIRVGLSYQRMGLSSSPPMEPGTADGLRLSPSAVTHQGERFGAPGFLDLGRATVRSAAERVKTPVRCNGRGGSDDFPSESRAGQRGSAATRPPAFTLGKASPALDHCSPGLDSASAGFVAFRPSSRATAVRRSSLGLKPRPFVQAGRFACIDPGSCSSAE
jgi:hypothetical protein